MRSFKVLNIFDEIKPIHLYSQIFGLTSFSIRKNNSRHQSFISPLNVLCFVIAITWNIFSIRKIIVLGTVFNFHREILTLFYEKCVVILICVFVIVTIGVNFWLLLIRGKIVELLRGIEIVDDALSAFDCPINHSKYQKIAFIYLMSTQFICSSGIVASYMNSLRSKVNHENLFLSLSKLIGTNYFLIICLHCIFLLLALLARYRKINLLLCQTLKQRCSQEMSNEKIQKLADLHDKLVDVTSIFSVCYGFPVSFHLVFKL